MTFGKMEDFRNDQNDKLGWIHDSERGEGVLVTVTHNIESTIRALCSLYALKQQRISLVIKFGGPPS